MNDYRNCPPTGLESGLVGYWNFEEGSSSIYYDLSITGNDGYKIGNTNHNIQYSTNLFSNLLNNNGNDSTVLNLTINQGDTSYTSVVVIVILGTIVHI